MVPADFPAFRVPGFEREMALLRDLAWEHFIPEGLYWDDWLYAGPDGNPPYPEMPAGPKATLWDEWLSGLLLVPAVETGGIHARMVERWNRKLSTRRIDADGYVDTDQGHYFAHTMGWPFPVWSDGLGGRGWHFSFKGTPGWYRPNDGKSVSAAGWVLQGGDDKGIDGNGWNLTLRRPGAAVLTPPAAIDSAQAPFLQLRWRAARLGSARPRVQWTTPDHPEFGPDCELMFAPPEDDAPACTMIPVFRHPGWTGRITSLRIAFGNESPGADIQIQAFFTAYDTRHNINNMNFVRGCANYFWYTRDFDFLRRNIDRIRTALKFALDEHHVREEKIVLTTWPGHDGLGGVKIGADGSRSIREGHGLSDNWWDILPFGGRDFYATIHLYNALRSVAQLEEDVRAHPEWKIGGMVPSPDPGDWPPRSGRRATKSSGTPRPAASRSASTAKGRPMITDSSLRIWKPSISISPPLNTPAPFSIGSPGPASWRAIPSGARRSTAGSSPRSRRPGTIPIGGPGRTGTAAPGEAASRTAAAFSAIPITTSWPG
jgi:hypothetical protein